MPIYMDKHIVPGILAQHAAEAHQKDLAIQHEHGCNCMTYWVDEQRGHAFCLIEAPDIRAVREMHDRAHGLVPHEIIEVDEQVVLSFLGRIHDPQPEGDASYPLIRDPAYRAILVAMIDGQHVRSNEETTAMVSRFYQEFNRLVAGHAGRVIEGDDSVLASFSSMADAVHCALDLRAATRSMQPQKSGIKFTFGLSAGSPVANSNAIFGEAIRTGQRLAFVAACCSICATSEIAESYRGPRMQELSDEEIQFLSVRQIAFLNQLFDVMEEAIADHSLRKTDLTKRLGISGSKLYRLTVALTGRSPHDLLKELRLRRAARLLQQKGTQVSEACYEAGFSSPSYFTKCFKKRFGILPADFSRESHGNHVSF